MVTLTSLPISLQSRILKYLYDDTFCDEQVFRRALLNGLDYSFPLRHPETHISLDRLRLVPALLPSQLLSPALASPILAAAAFRLLEYGIPYLTDRSTEGQLPLWVKAFSPHIQAISVADVAEACEARLTIHLKNRIREKLCCDAVHLFREVSENQVRLKVLDLVHVPFDGCDEMEGSLMNGLCTTLESCQRTLKELALPIYSNSELCTRALESVTLPHLTLLSIELRDTRNWSEILRKEPEHNARPFLGMMQAVDGHADRVHGLTVLEELRLINLYCVPCERARNSGCSTGFFHAIKTLRVSTNRFFFSTVVDESRFFYLFTQLERLYWTGMPMLRYSYFEKLSRRLKEVHFCHHDWIAGPQVGAKHGKGVISWQGHLLYAAVWKSHGKIRTLVWYSDLLPYCIQKLPRKCPNLQYLSLCITRLTVDDLGKCIRRCERLKSLEIIVNEDSFGRLGRDGWMKMGKAIPREHPMLRELAIQRQPSYRGKVTRMDVAIDCLVAAVERIGAHLERLAFRATLRFESLGQTLHEIWRVLDACLKHSQSLSYLELRIVPCERFSSTSRPGDFRLELDKVVSSGKALIQSRPRLTKIDLGLWHRFLRYWDGDRASM